MKKFFILFILLSACLKLSAFAIKINTIKLSDTTKIVDSLRKVAIEKHIDSLKIPVTAADTDTTKTILPVKLSDTAKMLAAVVHKDSLILYQVPEPELSVTIHHSDKPKLFVTIKKLDTSHADEKEIHPTNWKPVKWSKLDSLKEQVRIIPSDSLRGNLYTQIAGLYMNYDTVASGKKQISYQNLALSYTLKALHFYSRSNDSTGLRISFDHLAKVYFDQKKYSEAKWFILQSNTLSRARKDVPNTLTSLIVLADIKSANKDYDLAIKDLNEALDLSTKKSYSQVELIVLKNYAMLYSRMKNYPKEALMLKKRDSLVQTIEKQQQDSLIAKLKATQDSIKHKSLDSLQKKKVLTSNIKKSSKSNSTKKIALL